MMYNQTVTRLDTSEESLTGNANDNEMQPTSTDASKDGTSEESPKGIENAQVRILLEIFLKSSSFGSRKSTGLFCLVVSLGGVFHPPSITPLSLKSDCSNFVQSYFQIG